MRKYFKIKLNEKGVKLADSKATKDSVKKLKPNEGRVSHGHTWEDLFLF